MCVCVCVCVCVYRDLAESLPGEEAALYDCMSGQLESLAAYLLLCPNKNRFVWPHLKHLAPPELDLPQQTDVDSAAAGAAAAAAAAVPATPPVDEHTAQLVLEALDGWGFGPPAQAITPDKPGGVKSNTEATPAVSPTAAASAQGPGLPSPATSPKAATNTAASTAGEGAQAKEQPAADEQEQAAPARTAPTTPLKGTERSIGGTPRSGRLAGLFEPSSWDLASLLASDPETSSNKLMPLLERFSFEGSLQIAQAVHPRYVYVASVLCNTDTLLRMRSGILCAILNRRQARIACQRCVAAAIPDACNLYVCVCMCLSTGTPRFASPSHAVSSTFTSALPCTTDS